MDDGLEMAGIDPETFSKYKLFAAGSAGTCTAVASGRPEGFTPLPPVSVSARACDRAVRVTLLGNSTRTTLPLPPLGDAATGTSFAAAVTTGQARTAATALLVTVRSPMRKTLSVLPSGDVVWWARDADIYMMRTGTNLRLVNIDSPAGSDGACQTRA